MEMPWLEETGIWESSWQPLLKIEFIVVVTRIRPEYDMFVYISRGLTKRHLH